MVTTFKTAGTYKNWLWPNSAHITYAWHALLIWHTYLHTYIYIYIYIYTAQARICTPLIVSRSLRSLANYRGFLLPVAVGGNLMWACGSQRVKQLPMAQNFHAQFTCTTDPVNFHFNTTSKFGFIKPKISYISCSDSVK